MRSVMAAIVVCTSAVTAWGQFPSSEELVDRLRGGGVLMHFVMLEQPSVQKEINATPQQVQAAKELTQQLKGELQGLAQLQRQEAAVKVAKTREAAQAALNRLLSPPQIARLQQIGLQQAGPLIGMSNPDVAKSLSLNPMQQSQLRELQESLLNQAVAAAQSTAGGARGRALLQTLRELQSAKQTADAKSLAMLSPEQQARWKQLQGAPFQGETQFNRLRDRFGR